LHSGGSFLTGLTAAGHCKALQLNRRRPQKLASFAGFRFPPMARSGRRPSHFSLPEGPMTDRLVFERVGSHLTLNWYHRDARGHIFMTGPREVSGLEAVEKLVLFLGPASGEMRAAAEGEGGERTETPSGD
jgi:hypothetical protein